MAKIIVTKIRDIFCVEIDNSFNIRNMKQSICMVVILCLCSMEAFGQKMSYSYDSAGNRIKREIVLSPNRMPKAGGNDISSVSDLLGDKKIKILPNPSQGIIQIEIVGYEDSDVCTISLYSVSGQILTNVKIISNITDIDISGFPDGIYILAIQLNGHSSTWTIIK